jgi:hypothetical protein
MNYRLYFRNYSGLAGLLVIYLALALTYSYAIPFSKGPDEYINYQYILFIAQHQRLPATLSEKQEAGVKADWQPLYHLVAGIAAAPIDLTSPPELKVTWQPPTRQLIDLVLPRATLIRTEDERPPYRGVYALWQVGRLVSLALGAGTLILTYLLSLTLWPDQPALATGITALLVFMPRFLFTHAVLSDDTLLAFCLSIYLLLLVYLVQRSTFNVQSSIHYLHWLFVGLGLTAGLAIVTKYTAIPAMVGGLLTGAWLARRYHWSWQSWLRYSVLFLGAALLAVSWWLGWVWWHFNQIDSLGPVLGLVRPLLPGATVDDNPTTARLTALFSGQSLADLGEAPGAGGNLLDWAKQSFATFWGVTVFGAEPGWPYPYQAILAGLAIFCLVALVGLWQFYRRAEVVERSIWPILALHVLLFLPLPLLRFALSGRLNDAAQGRHLLFPAGPAIVILLMAGWLAWFPIHWRNRVALLMGGLILAWGGAHLAYLNWAYPPPLPVRTTASPQMQLEQPSAINFGNMLRLAGYQTQLAGDGSTLQIDLLWQSLAQAWEDYRTEISLIDRQGQPQLRWLSHPANGRFPVRAWQPGDWVRDTLHLPLAGLLPGDYKVQLRLLGWNEAPLASPDEIILTSVTIANPTQSAVAALWQQGEMIAETLPASFASSPPPAYRYRSTIPVTLPQPAQARLIGPDGLPRLPLTEVGPLRTFMVDYNWPSGGYQLQLDGQESGLKLHVENFDRRPNGWHFTSPPMMQTIQANFAGKIELLGYDLPLRQVKAGEGIPLVLYWRSLGQMRESYTMFVQLLDADLQRRGGYDRLPRENYPTYLWVPGEVVDDGLAVPVEAGAPNGIYTVRVGWYLQKPSDSQAEEQIAPLPLMQGNQTLDETSIVIGPIKIGGPPPGIVAETFSPQHPLVVDLGEVISLRGYDLKLEPAAMRLKLYWQSAHQAEVDYTSFIHLRNQAGAIVAQVDRPPVAGVYPTSLWSAGEVIPDEVSISLPTNLPPGEYTVVAGLYDFATGLRLPIAGSVDNSIELSTLKIPLK